MPKIRASDLWRQKTKISSEVVILTGEDSFWKAEALREVRRAQGEASQGGPLSLRRFDGAALGWRDFIEELETPSLFSQKLFVVVEEADAFVSAYQKELLKILSLGNLPGTVALSMKRLAANSNLARYVVEQGLWIDCSPADRGELLRWLPCWAEVQHQLRLKPEAARTLVDIVGEDPGLLAQQLAKLALFVGSNRTVSAELITEHCATWRVETIWTILDLAMEGRHSAALVELHRLLSSGVHPLAILGQMAGSLRRLALAAEHLSLRPTQAGGPTRRLLQDMGIPPGVQAKMEVQIRRLGLANARKLASLLLEVDFQLKGGSAFPEQVVLERLISWLADERVRRWSASSPQAWAANISLA